MTSSRPTQIGSELVGTFWVGPWVPRHNTRAVYRVDDVADYDNGMGRVVPMVYAERLDGGSKSEHPRGTVRKVSWVGAFTTHHRQVSEREAIETADD